MKKKLWLFAKVVSLYVGIFLFVRFVLVPILETYIAPPAGTNLEDYLDRLVLLSIVGFIISALASCVWEWRALYFRYTKEELMSSRYRFWWWLLFFVCCVVSYACFEILRRPNEGAAYITLFLFGITIGPYYIATLFFSPSGAKYVPPFPRLIRHWK